MRCHLLSVMALLQVIKIQAQHNKNSIESIPPQGNGMKQHDFLYAGEWQNSSFKDQQMFIVKDGKIVWSYTMPWEGEYGDTTLLSNGDILFSHFHGASEVTPNKKIVWNYDAPANCEIHTCQPLGNDKVFMMLNMVPAKAIIMNKKENAIVKELTIPTGGTATHGMFRHCRYTKEGTFLMAHMDMGKVIEYDSTGKAIWSVDAPSAWAAIRLKNGNTLISGNQNGYVREVNKKGKIVWEFTKEDAEKQGVKIYTVQQVERLANGNTVITNWNGGNLSKGEEDHLAQIVEVTPNKKIVWVLSQWNNPNLNRASGIQILGEKGIVENGDLER
ncbi:MAG: PQQ-binding-like beta-propeller repeat protein [Ginsengibacter sp.]